MATAVFSHKGGKSKEPLKLDRILGPRSIAWGPDSRTILFVKSIKTGGQERPNQNRNELWSVSTETGESRKLGDLPDGRGIEISCHPNGRSLVFNKGLFQSEIWTMGNILPADMRKEKSSA